METEFTLEELRDLINIWIEKDPYVKEAVVLLPNAELATEIEGLWWHPEDEDCLSGKEAEGTNPREDGYIPAVRIF